MQFREKRGGCLKHTHPHSFRSLHPCFGGAGALVNLLIGELFLQSSRSSAYVIGEFSHWFLNGLTVLIFIHIETFVGPYSLLLCSPMSMAAFFYVLKMIPETKGKTFLEIRGLVPAYRSRKTLVQEPPSE
ncbi:solute carrier family 2, facilitated glucose transporter member 5-like [Python bivittatus]|uniref:Solute carrier family 2, facilitated glucose transporter member 5-like n=1 Tax=Python bivittatus TaxID=176946 RepID=A0A9F5INV8_PYTBI|nr:solute carrier family 2, facilitated glucose transporter member 5-like [Python bivittatus]